MCGQKSTCWRCSGEEGGEGDAEGGAKVNVRGLQKVIEADERCVFSL
jgi:hypothetical protein